MLLHIGNFPHKYNFRQNGQKNFNCRINKEGTLMGIVLFNVNIENLHLYFFIKFSYYVIPHCLRGNKRRCLTSGQDQ